MSLDLRTSTAIVILSADDGSRIFAKYYDVPHKNGQSLILPYPDVKSQKAFEKGVLEKTAKQTGDVTLFDNQQVFYKSESDVMMYVVCGDDQPSLLMYPVIICLRDALHLLFKQSVDKRTLLENYDLLSLAVDEIIDGGIIVETDPTIVASRVSKPTIADTPQIKSMDLSEQSVTDFTNFAKSKIGQWMQG